MTQYTITHNYGQCPNQIEGYTDEGEHFYFRGRQGKWQLHFGNTAYEAIDGEGYEGVNKKAGWYEEDEWEFFFWKVIKKVEAGKAKKLDIKQHNKDTDELLAKVFPPFAPVLEERERIIKILEDYLPDYHYHPTKTIPELIDIIRGEQK